jgi:hypothetical protein
MATRNTSKLRSARQLRLLAGIPKKTTLANAAPPTGTYQRLGRESLDGTTIDVVVLRVVVEKLIVVEPEAWPDMMTTAPAGVQPG